MRYRMRTVLEDIKNNNYKIIPGVLCLDLCVFYLVQVHIPWASQMA